MNTPASSVNTTGSASQLSRFVVVGASTVFLDFVVLYLLATQLHVGYLMSTAAAFVIASTVNYLLSIQFVFESGKFGRAIEFSYFPGTSLLGLPLIGSRCGRWLAYVESITWQLRA